MDSKDAILGRIREALKAKAPAPGQHAEPGPATSHTPPANDAEGFRHWLPAVGATWEEQCQLFAQNAASLKAEFKVVPTPQAATEELNRLAHENQWRRLASHRSPLLDPVCAPLGFDFLHTDAAYATADLEKCEAGISACEALVAQTGSVLITSRSCGGRALSVLPPHHVVVATRDQLVPDLPAAFTLLQQRYAGDFPSTISFITGPSRTGDIERILVLGAHGPKRLTILLIG